jgi:5'-nucleotidase
MPQILYVDLDGVMCDYQGAWDRAKAAHPEQLWPQSVPGFFRNLVPMVGAIDGLNALRANPGFDVHILTAPSVSNPPCYSEKRIWVEEHLGFEMCPRLIIAYDKSLLRGDFLIDDHDKGRGQEGFQGALIHFGSSKWPDWAAVLKYFA